MDRTARMELQQRLRESNEELIADIAQRQQEIDPVIRRMRAATSAAYHCRCNVVRANPDFSA